MERRTFGERSLPWENVVAAIENFFSMLLKFSVEVKIYIDNDQSFQ